MWLKRRDSVDPGQTGAGEGDAEKASGRRREYWFHSTTIGEKRSRIYQCGQRTSHSVCSAIATCGERNDSMMSAGGGGGGRGVAMMLRWGGGRGWEGGSHNVEMLLFY